MPSRHTTPIPETSGKQDSGTRIAWAIALVAAVAPLWVARDLPMVDLPQHLYVLDVLARLRDPATLYPQLFELQPRWTPYVGYYAVVAALHTVFALEFANRLFLTAIVAGLPLAMAFLLSSLRKPTWPALLVTPFAYGDSFGWGFVSTSAAMPVAIFTLGAWIRAIERPRERIRWSVFSSLALLAGFALHPVPTGFLAIALPLALLMTRAPEDTPKKSLTTWLRPRLPLLGAVLPLGVIGVAWFVTLSHGDPGGRLRWETPVRNLQAFPWLLANLFVDGRDSMGLLFSLLVGLTALISRFFESSSPPLGAPTGIERARPFVFFAIAFGLFMTLPLDMGRAIQYLSPRFAALAATLGAGLVPRVGRRTSRWLPYVAVSSTIALAVGLVTGFRDFSQHAAALRRVAEVAGERPRIMGLVFEPHAPNVHHPVFLHGATVLARLRGGVPSYSLIGWSQVPLGHRGTPAPAPPSEWRPDLFDYATMAPAYDHFLVRGASPDSLFAGKLGTELTLVSHDDGWWLLKRSVP